MYPSMMMGALAFLLAACGGGFTADQASPSYRAGFNDGCTTASGEGSGVRKPPQRNTALYEQDSDYRSGWGSGHVFCRMDNGRQTFGARDVTGR